MNLVHSLWIAIYCFIGTISALPTAEVTSCSGHDVTIAISGLSASFYRGMPYIKGYEAIKDCIRLLHYDPVKKIHRLQFRMDYTDVRFGQDGHSIYHPSTSTCADVQKIEGFRAGSFETTVVLPRSTGVEVTGDLSIKVHCEWDYDVSQLHNGTAVVRLNQQVFNPREKPVVDIHVMTSSSTDTHVIRLGERVTLWWVAPETTEIWNRARIWSLEAVSRSRHKRYRIEIIKQGCLMKTPNLAALNLSIRASGNSWPTVSFNSFRFLTDPVLQLDATLHLCKTEESTKHCQYACRERNRPTTHIYQHTMKPATDLITLTREYEEVTTSVYLLVPYSNITEKKRRNDEDALLLSDVVLVLTTKDVTTLTVILFFILVALIVSAATVIAYYVILHHRKHIASVDLWKIAFRHPRTPSNLNCSDSESPCGDRSWMKNRLITPPPTFAQSLKFTNQISPLGARTPSTIDGKHYSAK